MSSYALNDYVEDLRRIASSSNDQNEIFCQLGPLAQQMAANRDWIEERFYQPDEEAGFSAFLLHQEADFSLAVIALAWAPGQGVVPHDHGTWAVVVGVEGVEENILYKRLDDRRDPAYAELEIKKRFDAGPGDLVMMKQGGIHAVRNHSDQVTLSLHTYGMHFNKTLRSQFDVEARRATEFEVPMK
ncbi:hypothetical protein ACTL6U_11085 [Rhodovibrionaceae bacterium A322]